jgi:hypothetical protein
MRKIFFIRDHDIDLHKIKRVLTIKKEMDNRIHTLKRITQKVGIKFSRMMNPQYNSKMDQSERETSSIFRKLLKEPESELLTSPLSGKYYIRAHDKSMLLVLGHGQISIVNHVYGYNVPLSQKTEKMLTETFIEEVEKRRNQMEDEYKNNVQHSLQAIIKKLNEKEQ